MSTLFKISDSDYQDAARGVAGYRAQTESNVNAADIEKVIRAYVSLGQNKKIVDWYYSLPESTKDAIIKAVQTAAKGFFTSAPDYNRTYNTFTTLDNMALYGGVNERIIRPRKWQEDFERTTAEVNKTSSGVFARALQNGVSDFFGVIKNALSAIAKGLGLDLGTVTVILIIFLLIAVSSAARIKTS